MRGIGALHSVPGDNKFHFKHRAHALLLRWGKLVTSSHGALSTSGSIADSPIPSSERPGSSSAQSITYHTETPHAAPLPRDTMSSQPAPIQKADLLQAKARLCELLEAEEMAEEEASGNPQSSQPYKLTPQTEERLNTIPSQHVRKHYEPRCRAHQSRQHRRRP